MFHTIYKIAVFLIVPAVCAIVEYSARRKDNEGPDTLDIAGKWFVFWALGISAVTAGLMQMLNPAYTAGLLAISTDDYVVIRELGFANFSMGMPAVISLKYGRFRQSAAMTYGLYLALCVMIHLSRVNDINFEEIVSMLADICGVVIAVVVVVRGFRGGRCVKE